MSTEWIFAIVGLFGPTLIGGMALVINMRIEIAVMKEKLRYQGGKIGELLALLPGGDVDRTEE